MQSSLPVQYQKDVIMRDKILNSTCNTPHCWIAYPKASPTLRNVIVVLQLYIASTPDTGPQSGPSANYEGCWQHPFSFRNEFSHHHRSGGSWGKTKFNVCRKPFVVATTIHYVKEWTLWRKTNISMHFYVTCKTHLIIIFILKPMRLLRTLLLKSMTSQCQPKRSLMFGTMTLKSKTRCQSYSSTHYCNARSFTDLHKYRSNGLAIMIISQKGFVKYLTTLAPHEEKQIAWDSTLRTAIRSAASSTLTKPDPLFATSETGAKCSKVLPQYLFRLVLSLSPFTHTLCKIQLYHYMSASKN